LISVGLAPITVSLKTMLSGSTLPRRSAAADAKLIAVSVKFCTELVEA